MTASAPPYAGRPAGAPVWGGEEYAATRSVQDSVLDECQAQVETFGVQSLRDGTRWAGDIAERERAKADCEAAARDGRATWRHVLLEEVREALAEKDAERLEAELVQVAAVAVSWVRDLRSRS